VRPHSTELTRTYALTDESTVSKSQTPRTVVVSESSPPSSRHRDGNGMVGPPAPSAVPPARPRSASPLHVRQNLRSEYVPPPQTTTRSGRISHPAARLNL